MDVREVLCGSWLASRRMLELVLTDVTEADSVARGAENINPIRWQVGHLAASARFTAKLIDPALDWPDREPFRAMFGRGSTLLDDPRDYPPLAELKTKETEAVDAVLASLQGIDVAKLEAAAQLSETWQLPLWNAVVFLGEHAAYHAGQIAHIRAKVLKKPPAIG